MQAIDVLAPVIPAVDRVVVPVCMNSPRYALTTSFQTSLDAVLHGNTGGFLAYTIPGFAIAECLTEIQLPFD